ncbi:mitochondrial GTPase 1 homolog (S. cerevisiae), isoform CRA_a [Mus musculus]|nr:mitochondrial GTPase 1 homolog (S. cerevisiae), isoform CRA_a [Mus musculus]EDL17919.1 mitochondrial GTPase 1 homolog (S. cerevisiae), isoform CRA_a [Mus musculus]
MRLWPQAWGAVRGAWRECFPLQGHDVARWFPGHMAKGLKKMQSSLKSVDCVIEVHDATHPIFRSKPSVPRAAWSETASACPQQNGLGRSYRAAENCPALRRKRPEQRSLHELCER